MKRLEVLLGSAALLLALATGGLAVFNLGIFATKGTAAKPVSEQMAAVQSKVVDTSSDEQPAEGVTGENIAQAAVPAPEAMLSVAAGEKVFKKCKACHTAEQDGGTKTGPNLWSVLGRNVASNDSFEGYSDDLRGLSEQAWDVALLDEFLTKPKTLVKGTKMTFAGLKKPEDRQNVILYLAQHSDAPKSAADLGFSVAAVTASATTETDAVAQTETAAAPVEIEPVPYPEGVTYANAPERSAEKTAEIEKLAAELNALAPALDYERSRFYEMHFPPAINEASNEQCLACHQEILTHKPRAVSPAGVGVAQTLAWYQTLDTYEGDQETFHFRHLESDFAKQVMNLECNFCHKGNDPREESPDMIPTRAAYTADAQPEFTLRKMVNPSTTCLRCHGSFPDPEIMGLEGPWHEIRADMEYPEAPNGCMSCHAESFRTVRHNVDYLNAANIEELARNGSADTCYGCHGGRAWYRISYPYPRHAWPDMDEEVPEWAVDRLTSSDPEYALPAAAE